MMDIETLCVQGIQEWNQTKRCVSLDPWKQDLATQQLQEQQIEAILKDVLPFLDAFPHNAYAQKVWKQKGITYLKQLLNEAKLPFFQGMGETARDLFQDITFSFLRDVRMFDSTLSLCDAMQALRNVWIIAILECLFQKYAGYHKAMFAYSMLYPYSDNYLDDPNINAEAKKSFNAWFTARLKGDSVKISNEQEQKISDLVSMIEEKFPRQQYACVYEALMQIQKAQIISLTQQDGALPLRDDELMRISYQKGGTSVVADGFLIDGTLTEDEITFCMRYGFMLQLGDDLQDGQSDAKLHHQTLVSNHITSNLDGFLLQLIQYTIDILQPQPACEDQALLEFVQQDCLYLLFFAMLQKDHVLLSDDMIEEINSCLPVSASFCKEKQTDLHFSYAEEALWERMDALLF